MRKVGLKQLLCAGLLGCIFNSFAYGAPQSSLTPLYTLSDQPGACHHAISPASVPTDCDIASMDQSDYSSGAQIFYPTYIASFQCTGVPLIQAGHTWTAFFSQVGTHYYRDVFNGGTVGRHPILKAVLFGIDRSGVTNNGTPLLDGTSELRYQQGDGATKLAVAKTLRGGLQTMLSGFNPIITGGVPYCLVSHPGQILKHLFENPQYITTNPLTGQPNDWWGPVAFAVTSAIHDQTNPLSLCSDPNTPLAQYIKDYIECE